MQHDDLAQNYVYILWVTRWILWVIIKHIVRNEFRKETLLIRSLSTVSNAIPVFSFFSYLPDKTSATRLFLSCLQGWKIALHFSYLFENNIFPVYFRGLCLHHLSPSFAKGYPDHFQFPTIIHDFAGNSIHFVHHI